MKKIKVLTIFGTRPEAIKLAPVIKQLKTYNPIFKTVVCVTAQHRKMLDQILSLFEIVPEYDLNIMTTNQSLAYITKAAVGGLDGIIAKEKSDIILVQGDTTTTLCGALVAFYNKTKVAHVEAGLRTDDKYVPFPEEINRRLTTQLADFHFAPTPNARLSLIKEGVADNSIYVTGNTVIDALLWVREKVRDDPPELPAGLEDRLDGQKVVLVTGHRRESFGQGFEDICQAIRVVADMFLDVIFVYPVHLNPNVQEPVNRILGGHDRIILIPPQPYLSFVWIMDHSTIVLTDSGGVQEEAPSLGKPVLVMRDTTERPEGIESGNTLLVGVKKDSIISGLTDLLKNPDKRDRMSETRNPYGDGKSAARIVNILQEKLGVTSRGI